MITPSFSLTATERVLPRLALDFTTAALDPRVTITRALNTATVTNANGSISIVNANLPRFDYANGVCKGLLIEETRANLLLNSILDGAVTGTPGTPPTSWTNVFNTGTISAITSATYAAGFALAFTCSAQRRAVYQRVNVSANTSYTVSFDITVGVGTVFSEIYQMIDFRSMPAGSSISGYTLDGVAAAGSANIPVGAHKVTATAAIAGTAGTIDVYVGLGIQANATATVTISNIQLEAGAFATSYIPTTTTSLTRNADVVTMTGTNFSDWYNATEGTFYSEFDVIAAANAGGAIIFMATDGTKNGYAIYKGSSSSSISTIVGTNTSVIGSVTVNDVQKAILGYNSTNIRSGLNRNGLFTTATASVGTLSRLNLGRSWYAGEFMSGHIRKINYWPQKLTDAELTANIY